MTRDTFHELIFPVLLSAAIAFCAIGCLITAFGLTVESHLLLALLLVLLALIYTLLPQWRFGPVLFAAALIGVILYFHEPLLLSLEKLLYTISSVYDQHLRCGCIRWSDADLSAVSCLPILLPIGLLLIMPIIWTLRFQGFFVFALIPGLVPLLLCCIVKDTVPDLAYLIALVTLLLLILLTQLTRRVSHGAATRLTALLLVPALLFASVSLGSAAADPHTQQANRLYARITAFFSRQEGNNGSGPGRTDPQVDLTAVGPKKPSDAPAMTVQANHTGILYLRGQAYTHYTGHSWYTPYTTPDGGGWPTGGMVEKGPVSIIATTQTIRYTPYYVRDEDWTDRLQGGAFRNPNRKTVYTFQWMAPDSSLTPAVSPLSEEAKHAATALPASTQHTALSILADILKDAPGDVQTQANLIGDYVRDSARYSLYAGGMPESETDFAIWFLQNGNLGYCVHFASAATVLLRAAGIPARYVSGYITYTIPGVPVPVTDRQAHAWVEYYHPIYGWTVLEVTPGAEDIPDIPTAPTESTTEPTETTQPAQTVGTTAPAETTAPPAQSRPQAVAPTEPPAPSLDQQTWFRWLMGCLLTVAFLLLQYGLRQNLRRRWLEAQTPKQKLLRRWKYTRFLARLTRQAPPESLHFLAEKAAFSQHAPTAEECRQFDLWLQQTRQTLLQKPWPLRLLLRLLLAL